MALRIRINPIDNVLAVLDHTLQRQDGTGFNCVLVLELDGEIDPERLVEAARQLGQYHVLTQARLHRPWWAKHPHWIVEPASSIPVDFDHGVNEAETAAVANEILNRRLDPRHDPPVQVFVRKVPGGKQTLIFKWSHVLTDVRGGDFLLQQLGRCYAHGIGRDSPVPTPRPDKLSLAGPKPWWPSKPRCSTDVCRVWGEPTTSRLRLKVVALDEAESAAIRRRCLALAGFGRQGMAMLSAAFRLMQREAIAAGFQNGMVRAHWPVALREGPMPSSLPGNEFGLVHLERPVREAADPAAMVEQLTRETIDQLSRGEHRRAWVQARWLWAVDHAQLCWINDHNRFLMKNDRSALHFRYAGRLVGGGREWGGLGVASGFAATINWREKPVGVGISETAGRFHLSVTWMEGSITEPAADRLIQEFREELLSPPGI